MSGPTERAPGSGAIRVCVCDDSESLRRLLALQLEGGGFVMSGECGEAERCAAVVRDSMPDVVLVDHGLAPAQATERFFEALRGAAPGAALVLFSGLPEDVLAQQAAELELDGYLQKGHPASALRDRLAELANRR
jgi:DNA-binding NarL/FixJ family response regulator